MTRVNARARAALRRRDASFARMLSADVSGACARVKRALRRARFPFDVPATRIDTDLRTGAGTLFVAILRHALCERSRAVARRVADRGHDLVGLDGDLRFTERAFRATIDVFGYKPRVSAAQFVSARGFAVVKMTTVLDVLAHVEAMDLETTRRDRASHRRDERLATAERRMRRETTTRRTRAETTFVERDDDGWDEIDDAGEVDVRACDDDWCSVDDDEGDRDRGSRRETHFFVCREADLAANARARSRERASARDAREAIGALRVEFAEALGRLTRAEKELTLVRVKCEALERRVDAAETSPTPFERRDDDGDDEFDEESVSAPPARTHRRTHAETVDAPEESTDEFIARYLEKLRDAAGLLDEDVVY